MDYTDDFIKKVLGDYVHSFNPRNITEKKGYEWLEFKRSWLHLKVMPKKEGQI